MGARFNSSRTVEETNFGLFWAAITLRYGTEWLRDLAASQNLSIGDNARLCALVNLAMADAAITSWDSKIAFNFWRPLTAIRLGNDDTNPDTVGDPTWEPLINTPNYPDHTSGANNVTGAATRSLALFFGDKRNDVHRQYNEHNAWHSQSRTYHRFSDAADDVVKARIYEGIHFRFADEDARKQGRHVAQWVFGHFLKPLE